MHLFLKLIALTFCCVLSSIMATRVGGISDAEHQSDGNVQQMLASLSSEIKTAALETFSTGSGDVPMNDLKEQFNAANVTALGHKTQIVAGINYFVRTQVGDYVFHVRIYKDLQKNISLTNVIGPKEESDPINYF